MKTNRFLLVAIVAAGITCLICFTGCASTDMVETPGFLQVRALHCPLMKTVVIYMPCMVFPE